MGYFNFGRAPQLPRPQDQDQVWGNQHLLQPHVDQYKAYVLQVLQVQMSKGELHSTVYARMAQQP